ncbi:hypothetical protein [Massilia sp. YMA4]|uniref:Uncharacterized protein n=1 Tax=[Empedobacter] haloabium TaxID=592317 RepID=A0ABZ1URQ4_9BURK|nr:hypothetical protein [Massilia sp. YMA4]
MLLELAQVVQVAVTSADGYYIPSVESMTYEAKCRDNTLRAIEANGRLTLVVGKKERDLSSTQFYKSYLTGSYLGRFVASCAKDDGKFIFNFFGAAIPANGPVRTAIGTITVDKSVEVISDAPIKVEDVNLVDFNSNRLNSSRAK